MNQCALLRPRARTPSRPFDSVLDAQGESGPRIGQIADPEVALGGVRWHRGPRTPSPFSRRHRVRSY